MLKLVCNVDSVSIMSNDMIDSLANINVEIYSSLFAYSALLAVSERRNYDKERTHLLVGHNLIFREGCDIPSKPIGRLNGH